MTNSVRRLNFHQETLNVKLRVERREHHLEGLVVGEGRKREGEIAGEHDRQTERKCQQERKKWPSNKTEVPWKQITLGSSSSSSRRWAK